MDSLAAPANSKSAFYLINNKRVNQPPSELKRKLIKIVCHFNWIPAVKTCLMDTWWLSSFWLANWFFFVFSDDLDFIFIDRSKKEFQCFEIHVQKNDIFFNWYCTKELLYFLQIMSTSWLDSIVGIRWFDAKNWVTQWEILRKLILL